MDRGRKISKSGHKKLVENNLINLNILKCIKNNNVYKQGLD